jgi:two-component system response regulator BaeR
MSIHVLVVEDERKLADLLACYLESAGFCVTILYEGSAVMETVSREPIDIILLDWVLPGVDGLTLCRQLRSSSDVAIMMMTSRVEEDDRIRGLDTGADDYVCKPFSLREVVARVCAMRRRRQHTSTNVMDGLRIDDMAHRVLFNGVELDLTLVEYRLLKTLYTTPERAFSRDDLLDDMYKDNRIVNGRTITVHMNNLRRKLKECGLGDAVKTIHGIGYRWSSLHESGSRPDSRPPEIKKQGSLYGCFSERPMLEQRGAA